MLFRLLASSLFLDIKILGKTSLATNSRETNNFYSEQLISYLQKS